MGTGKRVFDFISALSGLLILSPILLVTGLIIWIKMGKPVFFKQTRMGLKGKPFTLFKFRSMTNERQEAGEEKSRITPLGHFLRSTSLDELPQLFNVLKGDMALVGPRPLLPEYLPLYNEHQSRRHLVRPGLTGWAQINGRNAQTWEQRFDLDVWYVENKSFGLDLKIIFLTFKKVFQREGINSSNDELMPPFRGSRVF